MSHYRQTPFGGRFCVDPYDENEKVQEQLYKKRLVAETLTLIIGTSGSGKSMATNGLAWEHWKRGFTVIYITEKPDDEFANAYCMFPPEREEQLNALKEMGLEPQVVPAKLYHPFTFNIPVGKVPPINFFTVPLKYIAEDEFASLLTGDIDAQTVRMCADVTSKMDKDENIFDFMWHISEHIQKGDKDVKFNDWYTPMGVVGDKRALGKIGMALRSFKDDFFLQKESSPHKLDFDAIINDQSHFHVLSTKFIPDRRLKFFVYLNFLAGIQRALASGNAKHQVLLVLEEVKVLLPKTTDASYEMKLAKNISRMLDTVRSKGRGVNVIATTQSYAETNIELRSSINERFIFMISADDKRRLMTDYGFGADKMELINSLTRGVCVKWEDLDNPGAEQVKGYANWTPFMHAEREYNFFEKFKKYYPGEMVDTRPLIKEMSKIREEYEAEAKARLEKYEEAQKKKAGSQRAPGEGGDGAGEGDSGGAVELSQGTLVPVKRGRGRPRKTQYNYVPREPPLQPFEVKTPEKKVMKETDDLRAELQGLRDKKKKDTAVEIYKAKSEDPTLSWSELGRRFEVTPIQAKVMALERAQLDFDEEFLKKWK